MFIRNLQACPEFVAGDTSLLRELFNPLKDDLSLRYSLAHATVKPGSTTSSHTLSTSEVYYILSGSGCIHIDHDQASVQSGDVVYIPPDAVQCIVNTGAVDLVFLCIVDPAWHPGIEIISPE